MFLPELDHLKSSDTSIFSSAQKSFRFAGNTAFFLEAVFLLQIRSGAQGFLRAGVQRCAGGPTLGQRALRVRRNAYHQRLHPDIGQVLPAEAETERREQ